ncbi:hypothetical protein [Sorangium cellulosum]|uniref:hypothetical protein n=1 Tax=Sorangium TaxID=39643 RepID=UPI001F3E8CC4|nr:hypothetical protein [Sorangium cellulosum]
MSPWRQGPTAATYMRSAANEIVGSIPGLEGLSLDPDALWGEVELLGPESGEGALRDPEAQQRCRPSRGIHPHRWPALEASPST